MMINSHVSKGNMVGFGLGGLIHAVNQAGYLKKTKNLPKYIIPRQILQSVNHERAMQMSGLQKASRSRKIRASVSSILYKMRKHLQREDCQRY